MIIEAGSASMENQQLRNITCEVFRTLNDPNLHFMERSILSSSKYNSQKKQSLYSFPKHSNAWKQKLKLT